jgi:hypothetical protein
VSISSRPGHGGQDGNAADLLHTTMSTGRMSVTPTFTAELAAHSFDAASAGNTVRVPGSMT